MQAYSDATREHEQHALPDVEVFYMTHQIANDLDGESGVFQNWPAGYYWWSCFPGCLPDSEPYGPFDTEADALADARQNQD